MRVTSRRVLVPVAAVAASTFVVSHLSGAEDLLARVTQLRSETQYEVALSLLDDPSAADAVASDDRAWLQAQLTADADRFDALMTDLLSGSDVVEPAVQSRTLAHARERFARGQYRGSFESLRTLPAEAHTRLTEVALFEGMAALAIGDGAAAQRSLTAIPRRSAHFAPAQALLAHVAVKTGRHEAAMDHARRALDAGGDDVGAQALFSLVQAARALGAEDEASRARAQLLRRFPRSVEAEAERVATVTLASTSVPVDSTLVVEEEAQGTRNEFALQFGAFHDRGLALRMVQQLTRSSVVAAADLRIETDRTGSPTWYRVIGGRYQTRRTVQEAQERLRAAGIDTLVLQPGRGGR